MGCNTSKYVKPLITLLLRSPTLTPQTSAFVKISKLSVYPSFALVHPVVAVPFVIDVNAEEAPDRQYPSVPSRSVLAETDATAPLVSTWRKYKLLIIGVEMVLSRSSTNAPTIRKKGV